VISREIIDQEKNEPDDDGKKRFLEPCLHYESRKQKINNRTWRLEEETLKSSKKTEQYQEDHKTKKPRWSVPFEGYLKDLTIAEVCWAQAVRFFASKEVFPRLKKKKQRKNERKRQDKTDNISTQYVEVHWENHDQ